MTCHIDALDRAPAAGSADSSASCLRRRFAVVGSGASGCYAVEALLREDPQILVDVIERLPTPFGLIRYGVAPDHQGTKAVTRTLERFLGNDRVRYFGAVSVGRDVTLDELMASYDGVILATGVNQDRKLGVSGEELRGVLGSGAFAAWYNDHPDAFDASDLLARTRNVVVVGVGNVALDVARLLIKRREGYAGSDLSPAVAHALVNAPIERVHIVGRRSLTDAKFSLHECRELVRLAADRITLAQDARADVLIENAASADLLQELLALPVCNARETDQPHQVGEERRSVRLHFGFEPVAFVPVGDGSGRVGAVRFAARSLERDNRMRELTLAADLVVTCVGYSVHDRLGLETAGGALLHTEGRIRDRLYVVGWAKRGPSGTIGSNRIDSHAVVARACAEVPWPTDSDSPRQGIEASLRARNLHWVDFAGWKRIDRAELAQAEPDRARRKLDKRIDQLAVALSACPEDRSAPDRSLR
ncbi:FAD-dependent oxidoreductase [Paraburkholderia xenovorans]